MCSLQHLVERYWTWNGRTNADGACRVVSLWVWGWVCSCQAVGCPAWTTSCSAEEGEGPARYQIYSGQQLAHASMFSKCRALWRTCILWHESIYYRLVLWVNNFLLQNNRVGLTPAPRTEARKRVNKILMGDQQRAWERDLGVLWGHPNSPVLILLKP